MNPLDRARRILLGPVPWLLESYSINDWRFEGRGWALPGYERADDYVFKINGVSATSEVGLPSPSLLKAYPFFESSGRAAFTISHQIEEGDKELRISYCNAYTQEPVNVWHDTFVPLNAPRLPVPGAEQLLRTQGNTSTDRFLAYGFTTQRRIIALLQTYFQRGIASFNSILDWGCGCGRITRHLIEAAPGARIFGCDIDELNVQWCSENLSGAEFEHVGMMPPTGFESGQFDLILGVSVLTHLSSTAEKAWAAEIARLLRPGGIAVMTVHGSSGFARVLDDSRLGEILTSGRCDEGRDNRLDQVIDDKDYYRATYHTGAGAAAIFDGKLDLIASVQAANALVQDFLVLQRPVFKPVWSAA